MSLFDWFFPEQSQATQLRRIADQNRRERLQRSRASVEFGARVGELEENVGFVALLLGALLKKLDKQGVVSRKDLRDVMAELDCLDGVADGRLDVNVLRDSQAQSDVLEILDYNMPQDGNVPGNKQISSINSAAGKDEQLEKATSLAIERIEAYLDELRKRREQSAG